MSRRKKNDVVADMWSGFANNPERNRKTLYERMYVRMLTEICTNRFSWNNMPPEIDTRFLELELYRSALCVFFRDSEYDRYFALRGAGNGKWNMYDNPITFQVVGNTMISRRLNAGSDRVYGDGSIQQACVPIWANTLRMPDSDIIYLQATKLAAVERTIEITLKQMRHPFVFGTDDNTKLSMMNMFKQIDEGKEAIFTTPAGFEAIENMVTKFDLGVDKDLVLNLQIAKAKIWNESMTLLGINNANQEKRERLVSDEVSANDQQIMAVRNSAMSARQYAAEWINKVFDLNVEVEWNDTAPMGMTDSFAQYLDPSQTQRMEGLSDGQ